MILDCAHQLEFIKERDHWLTELLKKSITAVEGKTFEFAKDEQKLI